MLISSIALATVYLRSRGPHRSTEVQVGFNTRLGTGAQGREGADEARRLAADKAGRPYSFAITGSGSMAASRGSIGHPPRDDGSGTLQGKWTAPPARREDGMADHEIFEEASFVL